MSERWKPECGDSYWAVSTLGKVDFVDWRSEDFDYASFEFGNYFETAEEAEAAAEKVKALLLSLHEPTTNCNQLPKLTAEVFDRPDCPEWAKWAAVDKNGLCFFYHNKPDYGVCNYAGKWYVDDCKYAALIGEKFDPSDWQNSLIERPATLPDWCKVGEWVYHDSDGYYYTVKSIDIENDNIQISDGEREYTYTANEIKTFFSRARLRPYNADEMKSLVGKVVTTSSGRHCTLVTACKQEYSVIEPQVMLNKWLYATDLLHGGNTIDGKPCGKLEHLENGEWVE